MIEYMVYPDGEHFSCEEYDEHPSWKSDDYFILEIPDEVNDVDNFIYEYLTEVDLGDSTEQRSRSSVAEP